MSGLVPDVCLCGAEVKLEVLLSLGKLPDVPAGKTQNKTVTSSWQDEHGACGSR